MCSKGSGIYPTAVGGDKDSCKICDPVGMTMLDRKVYFTTSTGSSNKAIASIEGRLLMESILR